MTLSSSNFRTPELPNFRTSPPLTAHFQLPTGLPPLHALSVDLCEKDSRSSENWKGLCTLFQSDSTTLRSGPSRASAVIRRA